MPDDRLHHHRPLGKRQAYLAHRHPTLNAKHRGWGRARLGAGALTGLTNGYPAHKRRRRSR